MRGNALNNKPLVLSLLVVALALRHLTVFYSSAEILHLEALADSFARMDSGDWWALRGQLLGGSGIRFGGPLYTWLNYPARLLANPVLGAHLNNFVLELVSLLVWALWPTGGRLRPDVRWAAAALLVLYPEPKAEVCENAATMVHLLPPIFVTFLWATRPRAWISMLLPGLLLGAAALVHASAVAAAAALALTVVLQRELAVRRLLVLAAGAALCCVAFVHGAGHGADQGSHLWRWLMEHLSAGRAALLMLHMIKDPAALLGAGLVLLAWRSGPPSPARSLALSWLVCGGLFAALIYSRLDLSWDYTWPRFALVGPGRAVLAAVGLLWLLERLNRRRRASGRSPVTSMAALAGILLLAVPVMAAAVVHLRGQVTGERERSMAHPCMCDRVEREMWSRYRALTFDELLRGGQARRPGAAAAGGLLGKDLAVASRWQPSHGPPPRRHRVDPTAVFPRMSAAGRAGRREPLMVVPGCAALDTRALTSGRLALERGGDAPSDRLLVMLVNNQPTERAPAPVLTLVDKQGQPLRQVGRCACREEGPFIGGWYLFDLAGAPLQSLELVAKPPRTLTWEVHALVLPLKL